MTFRVSDSTAVTDSGAKGSGSHPFNSTEIFKSAQANSKTETDFGSKGNSEIGSVVPQLKFEDKGVSDSGSAKDANSGAKTEETFPPKLDFVDSAKDGATEKSTEAKAPLTESEKASMNKLRESIDSADLEGINTLVKQFSENPESLGKIAEHLNKELKPYSINAKVELGEKGEGSSPEASLTLSQMYQTDDAVHLDSVTFSTKSEVVPYERQSEETLNGGSGSGGPLDPSNDKANPTISRVLRKMSQDRTH